MTPPKFHPNNGATMWASIPYDQAAQFDNAVFPIHSQVPAGYEIFVIAPDAADKKGQKNAEAERAKEAFEAAFTTTKGMKFRPEYVEVWHARRIPPVQVVIGNNAWDKHPQYSGPEDTKVYVYIPKWVEEQEAEARRKEWEAREKAKIAAKATADQQAVETQPVPEGALAAGGPADPTLLIETPAPQTTAKAPSKKATTTPKKKAASKKKAP